MCAPRPCCLLQELLQQWSLAINAAVGQMPRRPRHLLVVINPYGGSRQARALYQSVVRPVFEKAGAWRGGAAGAGLRLGPGGRVSAWAQASTAAGLWRGTLGGAGTGRGMQRRCPGGCCA